MGFRHFIITRFNLRIDGPNVKMDKSGNEVLTNEWLSHRINIFNKYCLPSVAAQTNKDFLWLIYFDSTTDEATKQQNALLEAKYQGLVRIMYADGNSDFMNRYANDVLSLCSENQEYVITSRLDNDDIIHKDFIKKIQENFSDQRFTAVNFVKILMFNPEIKNKLHIDYIFSNHFISLIEKITPEGIKGCYCKGDRHWGDNDIRQINDKPYCVEIITDKNLLNSFRGFPVLTKTDLSGFQLENSIMRNKILDIDNLKIWKMSWRKFLKNKMLARK